MPVIAVIYVTFPLHIGLK